MAPLLVAMRGMPGVGKSALARAVSRELAWPVLDKDDIKDVVYGRTDNADQLAYDLLFWLARRQLQLGLSVVCDSPLQYPGLYALAVRTASEAGARLVVLECALGNAPEHRRRIEARAPSNRARHWAINDWEAFATYQNSVLPQSGYAIDAPRYVVDLSQPKLQGRREATRWLRSFMEQHAS
jgi:predicted kinase